jgi:hypothetical protein
MDSRRPVNSDVMQLLLTKRTASFVASIFLVALMLGACHKALKPPSAIRVSICDLYENPTAYNGKLITLDATATWLQDANYIYPGPKHNECGYSFIRIDAAQTQSNLLTELKPPPTPIPDRKEVDVEITGTFDSNYSEPWDRFRYKIVAVELKLQSPVRFGRRLGAA